MEEVKEIIRDNVSEGIPVQSACKIAKISKSGYYYRAKGTKKGKTPSSTTVCKTGEIVENKIVIENIKEIISTEFTEYGYQTVTAILKQKNFIINRKKVYRLMKENNLLLKKNRKEKMLKNYVKYSIVQTYNPFEIIEIDIKYIYIHGLKRNAYLITIFDTFTRMALGWELDLTMKHDKVIKLIDKLILNYLQPYDLLNRKIKINIRTDNGSQFIAKKVRIHLEENQIFHEFTKPRTPEQNGHIESFHATVENLVCSRFEFEDLEKTKNTFEKFYYNYNNIRVMKQLLYLSPANFLCAWENDLVGVKYDDETKKQKFFLKEKVPDGTSLMSTFFDFPKQNYDTNFVSKN